MDVLFSLPKDLSYYIYRTFVHDNCTCDRPETRFTRFEPWSNPVDEFSYWESTITHVFLYRKRAGHHPTSLKIYAQSALLEVFDDISLKFRGIDTSGEVIRIPSVIVGMNSSMSRYHDILFVHDDNHEVHLCQRDHYLCVSILDYDYRFWYRKDYMTYSYLTHGPAVVLLPYTFGFLSHRYYIVYPLEHVGQITCSFDLPFAEVHCGSLLIKCNIPDTVRIQAKQDDKLLYVYEMTCNQVRTVSGLVGNCCPPEFLRPFFTVSAS